jgi:AAA domain
MTNGSPIDFAEPAPNGRATPRPPITLLDGPAIAAPLPPLSYLVREIALVADAGPPHLVAGYGYSGKTLAIQSLALSLAGALPIWGFYSCRDARRVVHVDLEQGERLTRIRYQRLARAMGLDITALGDALGLAPMPGIALTTEYAPIWRELMKGRDLIVVDSLRAATRGMDENASGIRDALDILGELSERTACRALVIHHARKPSENAPEGGRYSIRGSSAIYDASDCAYIFSAGKGEPIRVAHERAKSHGETVDDFALVISDVEIEGDPRAGLELRVRGAELISQRREAQGRERTKRDAETIRAALVRHPQGLATMRLREAAGVSGQRFSSAVEHLGDAIVCREERRGKGRAAMYHYLRGQLPDSGGMTADCPASADCREDGGRYLSESVISSREDAS